LDPFISDMAMATESRRGRLAKTSFLYAVVSALGAGEPPIQTPPIVICKVPRSGQRSEFFFSKIKFAASNLRIYFRLGQAVGC
jgi:hypothetical protein